MQAKQKLLEKIQQQAILKISAFGNPDPAKLKSILEDIKNVQVKVPTI